MNAKDLVRKIILTEMVTLYRAPSQVQNAEQGAVFQGAIIDSLARFGPTETELFAVWDQFKRTWTKTIWPTPGDLCQALSRKRERAGNKIPHRASSEPYDPDFRPLTPAERAEFDDCVRRLRANPEQYFGSKQLLRMAEHFEKRDR